MYISIQLVAAGAYVMNILFAWCLNLNVCSIQFITFFPEQKEEEDRAFKIGPAFGSLAPEL